MKKNIILLLVLSCVLFSQVRHESRKIEIQAPGMEKKTYSLKEYSPRYDLKVYSSEKGFGNRVQHERAVHLFYADENTYIFITKSTGKNIGTFRIRQGYWRNFDIEDSNIEEHNENNFECTTPDMEYPRQEGDAVTPGCVKLYTEWAYNFYTRAGNMSTALTQIQNILAQSQMIFDLDSINARYDEVYVWTVQDPYTGSTSEDLVMFRNQHQPFTNNAGQLCKLGNGGGRAYLGGLCNPYGYAVSHISWSYAVYPSYSWTVNVITHEFGHVLGSHHTHWCGWKNDNGVIIGALDNCGPNAGYPTEGGCPPGPTPTNGGTIMSYCHVTSIGVNFNNRFGYYPRSAIRNYINSAYCLSGCDSVPPVSCSDAQEPNETKESSFAISKGTLYTAGLDVTGDNDWYKFTTTRNNTNISFQINNASHPVVLELYQNDSLVKTVMGSGNIVLIYNSGFRGNYYVKAAAENSALSGCYNLSLTLRKQPFSGDNASSELTPGKFALEQNYPNPFNPETAIKFQIPQAGHVKLTIYNLLGEKVLELINEELTAGIYRAGFNGSNFPSGVYYYELTAGNYRDTKKMVLIK